MLKTTSKPNISNLSAPFLALAVLSACGGGLVEQQQPVAATASPTQTAAPETAAEAPLPVQASSTSRDRFEAQDIELQIAASKAYLASLPQQPVSTAPVVADLSATTAFLFEKKSILAAPIAATTDPVVGSSAKTVVPSSTLGTTFDYLSAQVANLSAKVGLDTWSRANRPRPGVIPAPVPPSPGPSPSPNPIAPPVPAPASTELRWSNLATWGGTFPSAGADIVIPAGKTIILDTNPASIGALKIEGTLKFDARDIALTAASINVTGSMLIGSKTEAYRNKAVITLTGSPSAANDGVARGINVEGGQLAFYGTAPSPVWTKLNANAAAKATNFVLRDSTNWNPGDVIAMAPTDFYGVSQTERFTLTQANGTGISTNAGINQARWGVLQYVTSKGMSLTPEPGYVPPATPAPTVLDERAAVGNLSRNIVIQSIDDDAWKSKGFGVHMMFMDLKSKIVLDGVEIHRAGQAGIVGRYPIHWHRLSYSDAGVAMGDATDHIVQNSTVWESSNRCVVIHATNGVTVKNNICQDVKGHAFFLEDAVERRNVFEGNLALMMRKPAETNKLQIHEGDVYQAGPSGFWLTNPDNTVTGNLAGDATGNGFWMAFPAKPLGSSSAVNLLPNRMSHAGFEVNTAHSNRGPGVLLEWAPVDSAGNVTPMKYVPTTDGGPDIYTNRKRFQIKGITSYKNLDGAYRNRVSTPEYVEWVTADNVGVSFAGAGDDGIITRGLFVGSSLNNATPYPNVWPFELPSLFATYHSTFSMRDNTVVNFPFVENRTSGMFATSDYYLIAVDKGQVRNPNNRMINSNAGYRALPPELDGKPVGNRNWTLAGALWDPQGAWGPKENYLVYDVPFLTAGATCQWAEPAEKNGKSCGGQYFGVGSFQTDFDDSPYMFMAPIQITRTDSSGAEIGKWSVGDGTSSLMLPNMRHFAARSEGIYTLRFPGKPLPTRFAMDVQNAYRNDDGFIFAVAFDGRTSATGYAVAGNRYGRFDVKNWAASDARRSTARWFKPAASKEEVLKSTGDKIWQDTANNLVWVKFQGGLPFPNEASLASTSDDGLYRTYSLVIHSK